MTRPLAGGWLLVDPCGVGIVLSLMREGARSFVIEQGRQIPAAATPVLAAVSKAAYLARCAAATPSGGEDVESSTVDTITVTQAAQTLGVSASRVRQLIRAGKLTARRKGPLWTVDVDSVAARKLKGGTTP